jgi:hypothetical protein
MAYIEVGELSPVWLFLNKHLFDMGPVGAFPAPVDQGADVFLFSFEAAGNIAVIEVSDPTRYIVLQGGLLCIVPEANPLDTAPDRYHGADFHSNSFYGVSLGDINPEMSFS